VTTKPGTGTCMPIYLGAKDGQAEGGETSDAHSKG
jgi:hypothetical protein